MEGTHTQFTEGNWRQEAGTAMGGRGRAATWIAAVSAVAAIGSAVFAYRANDLSDEANDKADRANELSDEANEKADESNAISEAANDRAEQVALEERAGDVYLGEAPSYAIEDHPLPPGENVWMVVFNESGAQINGVWVQGEANTSIGIQGIENCSIYALDPAFDPVAIHYKDTSGQGWSRSDDSLTDDYGTYPDPDTHDSPWGPVRIEGCSG